ncbi:MAG: vesicle transport protein [Linnemannia gamsii]|nr:Golgi Transport [Mortierella sp. AD032]KAK3810546.1 MAG: vesicle transport protein [Linnemannia gamsii]
MTMWLSDTQKIGVGLTAFGLFFMLMGVMMFFDGGLLAIGNILFLAGLTLVIGGRKTLNFFARPQKTRGTICFFTGILLIFIKWPIIGIIVELFGFINLFGDFFPVIVGFLRRLPVIGNILSAPGISKIVDRISGQRLPV